MDNTIFVITVSVIGFIAGILVSMWYYTNITNKRSVSLDEWYHKKFEEVVTDPLKEKGTTLETATNVLKRAEKLKQLYEDLKSF